MKPSNQADALFNNSETYGSNPKDLVQDDVFVRELKEIFHGKSHGKVYIFGTGQGGAKIYEYLNEKLSQGLLDIHLCGFIDNNKEKRNTTFYGLDVINPSDDLNKILEADFIFIASVSYASEMADQLVASGVSEERIIKITAIFYEFLLTRKCNINPFYFKIGIRDIEEKKLKRKQISDAFREFMDSRQSLSIKTSDHPAVSIIIVLWNQADMTYYCLKNLTPEKNIDWEIIVVDNASTDMTPELLERIDGIRVIKNDDNLGFLKAVNQGAEAAKGEYLLLLNNDAVFKPGSLQRAISIFEGASDVGAVGGRLILPDQTLQEAGSVIWEDATTMGYMRGYKPEIGEVMFRRDVDYCCGAWLLTRRDLFEKFNGFDESFAPAYYEETDYCMRLRKSGYRIVYEPQIVIDHYEFGSSEKSDFAQAQTLKNKKLFREKHGETLCSGEYLPFSSENILLSRMRNHYQGNILVIDHLTLTPEARETDKPVIDLINSWHKENWFVTCYLLNDIPLSWDLVYSYLPGTVEVIQYRGFNELADFIKERKNYYQKILIRESRIDSVRRFMESREELPENVEIF